MRDAIVPGSLRSALAVRRLQEDDMAGLSTDERRVFMLGYRAGLEEAALFSGFVLASVMFWLCLALPMAYTPIRTALSPWARKHVGKGHAWVVWVQRWHHPVLDAVHGALSSTCGVWFYIIFLPFLFWMGESHLARQLSMLMALAIYVGNAFKDIVCSDRPDWARGVRLVGMRKDQLSWNQQEYGLPSTHTINTICLTFYMAHHYNYNGPGGGRWLHENLVHANFQLLVVGIGVWCLLIMWGRLYMGMHSPVDIAVGVVVALLVLLFYIPIDEYVDVWMTSARLVPIYQPVFAIVQLRCYPTPIRPNPSFAYVVYFVGVVLGIVLGVWRSPQYHSVEACQAVLAARPPILSLAFVLWMGRRLVVGLCLVLGTRALVKPVVVAVVKAVAGVLRLPYSDHDAEFAKRPNATPVGFNLNTPVRCLVYAVTSWAVAEPAFALFEWLGI